MSKDFFTWHKPLDEEGNDYMHGRCEFEGRRSNLVNFSLSVTCYMKNSDHQIIRFDSAHGFVHVHRFYRRPVPKELERLEKNISWDTVKELVQEIKNNYMTWKSAYIKSHLRGD